MTLGEPLATAPFSPHAFALHPPKPPSYLAFTFKRAFIAKGWIMLGHAVSEDAGMLEMAEWIQGFVPELPVRLIKAGEPFWVPG